MQFKSIRELTYKTGKFIVAKAMSDEKITEVYKKYHATVNMSASELESWSRNPCSRGASLSRSPITRNLRILRTSRDKWTAATARAANRTISFVSRMKGAEQGKPVKVDGKTCPSKRDISLKNWAYNPNKGKSANADLTKQAEVIDADERYAKALLDMVAGWNKDVLNAMDQELSKQYRGTYTKKGLKELVAKIKSIVNIRQYAKNIVDAIRYHYKQGIDIVEDETQLDIGYTDAMEDEVKTITQRELDGFEIEGKQWGGIKGVTQEVQQKLVDIVERGVDADKPLSEIKADVEEYMVTVGSEGVRGDATQTRAERIARTEANRIRNEGKIAAYEASGLKGEYMWDATLDNRTSDICNELHGKTAPFGGEFKSNVTGQSYKAPPAHVNCRSTLTLVLSE